MDPNGTDSTLSVKKEYEKGVHLLRQALDVYDSGNKVRPRYHTRNIHRNNPIAHKPKDPTISQPAPKEYKCGDCGKVYKTSHGLKHHRNTHHSNMLTKTQAQTQTQGQLSTQLSPTVQTQTTQTSSSVQTTTTL
ncbi:unnamed protein product, partial [Oppiella nova]